MGGLAGHMYHLYDNPSLTFREIKDILTKAANGKLVGTEKTDGQNLFISFSVRTGKAKAARNKGNIKDGGMSAEELANKYEGRGNIKEAFIDAFKAFEAAVKRFDLEDQIDIFGPDANIYYNAEVQDPRTANVINYGVKTLNIHRDGHCEFDKSTGSVIDRDLTKQFVKLETVLKDTQNKINQSDHRVTVNAIRNLSALTDSTVLKNTLNQLNQLQKQNKIKDSDTIAQYLINVIDDIIDQQFPNLEIETKKTLLKRMMKVKGVTVVTVTKTIPKQFQTSIVPAIKSFVEKEGQIYKQAIAPLENIIHEFAVEMLKSLQSAFVLDNKKEIERLRTELKNAKDQIEASSNEQAMEILKKQFEKIKNIENISTAAEGFVFSYNRNVYKFTGNFAPLNQILGLFKYGRGDVPALKMPVSENLNLNEQKEKSAVIVWGRFNPPTVGHAVLFNVAKIAADKTGSDLFIVPTKTQDDKKNPLTFEEKLIYLKSMFPEINKNLLEDSSIKTLTELANFLKQKKYTHIYPVAGSDRVEEGVFKILDHPDFNFKKVEIINAGDRDPDAEGAAGMSASKMRQAAIEGNIKLFMSGIAGSLDTNQAKDLLNKIRTRINQKPGARAGKKVFLEPIKEDNIEEMSAAVGVVGHVSSMPQIKKRQIELEQHNVYNMAPKGGFTYQSRYGSSQKRDDDDELEELFKSEGLDMKEFIVERRQFVEELKLRKIIKEAVKKKFAEKKNKILQEENKLRSIIRQILKEGEEDVPHSSTGINVLEDLLTKIIKIVEKDFKQLTTNPQQRKSFRAHIINAVKNSLATEKAVDDALENNEQELQEQDEEQIADPKFIDVGLDKGKKPEEADTFTIPGQETTGRNMALKTFDKIEKNVKDSYSMLSDKKDKDMFFDYLITNFKLYFDKFESEMNPAGVEPISATYDKEKQKLDSEPLEQPTSGEETKQPPIDQVAAAGGVQPQPTETPTPEETGLPAETPPAAA